jgi:ribosomal protein L3 glutamine methyltransferase
MTHPIDDLLTLRDWLRYAVSRFNAAGLVYGHGTSSALDEAAFLVLSGLHLPVDTLEPWLDARLTRDERQRLDALITARITTRKPAPYLVNTAYIQGHRFYVDERVIVPRSYLGELLCDRLDERGEGAALGDIDPSSMEHVLDLCTGSGCLAILAALLFPGAIVDAVDISDDALEVAKRNVADYGLDERVRLVRSDLFAGLASRRYDLIISNPPYVTAAAVAAFPPEYRAEPQLAHLGGSDGLDLVRRIIDAAPEHLTGAGTLLMEIGMGRDALEAAYPHLPFLWIDTAESDGEVFLISAADLSAPRRPAGRARKR